MGKDVLSADESSKGWLPAERVLAVWLRMELPLRFSSLPRMGGLPVCGLLSLAGNFENDFFFVLEDLRRIDLDVIGTVPEPMDDDDAVSGRLGFGFRVADCARFRWGHCHDFGFLPGVRLKTG